MSNGWSFGTRIGRSDIVTFVGGPLDLTRAAVDLERSGRRYSVPVLDRPVAASLPEGSMLENMTFGLATYTIRTHFNRQGDEVFVGFFDGFNEKTNLRVLRDDNERLRKALDTSQVQHRLDVDALIDIRTDLQKKLADATNRLSSIGNVLSAKDPGPQQASAKPRQMVNSRYGYKAHAEQGACAQGGCTPA